MAWEVSVENDGVVLSLSGVITLADIHTAMAESDELVTTHDLHHRITDLRDVAPMPLDLDDVHTLARLSSRGALAAREGRTAVVTTAGTFGGAGETFLFMVDNWVSGGHEVEVFHDIDEARAWARSMADDA